MIISVGDRVRYSVKSGRQLHSGAERWEYAIVAVWEENKRVLVSPDGTMIWAHTIEEEHIEYCGPSSIDELENVVVRLAREYLK
jgi:hypothetical protein